jgi:hypothetical protein
MSSGETGRKVYDQMRSEIVQRVQLRDNALILYLGSVGTIFGLALGQLAKYEILLIIPYLSMGVAAIISHHHSIIGSQISFIADELVPFFKSVNEASPMWEISETRKEYSARDINLRFLANLTLTTIPPIAGLILTYELGFYQPFPLGPLWWAGVVITIISIYITVESHFYRSKLLYRLKWERKKK